MIQALEKIPASGQYEEVIFNVPGSGNGESWNFVLFTTSDNQEWCGHFRGFGSNHLLVAELSNKNIACVISGGHGYLIDIDKKEKIKDLLSYPISGIIADEISSSFIVSTFYDITQINEELEEIDLTLPDQADGILLKEYKNRKINLEIEFICANERFNNDYYIDLDEMKIKKYEIIKHNKNMKLVTKLSFSDYFYFCKFDTLQRIKKYIIPIYILVLLTNIDLFSNKVLETSDQFGKMIDGVLVLIIFTGILYVFFRWTISYVYKTDKQTNGLISGKKEIILNNDYIKIQGELFETQLKWDIFNKIIETKQQFLLYTSLRTAYIIPKHLLNEIELQDLQKTLERKCIDLNLKFQKYT